VSDLLKRSSCSTSPKIVVSSFFVSSIAGGRFAYPPRLVCIRLYALSWATF
jgi:hypothetical protein